MAAAFHLHICSMTGDFYEGECVSLTLPLSDGELGLLANHSPVSAAVVPGALRCRLPAGAGVRAVVGHGLARFAENEALVLVEAIEGNASKE